MKQLLWLWWGFEQLGLVVDGDKLQVLGELLHFQNYYHLKPNQVKANQRQKWTFAGTEEEAESAADSAAVASGTR